MWVYKGAIESLLSKGAIEQCKVEEGQFLSSFFLVPKPDGSFRFILNLKELNKFINPAHFKMEDLRTAVKLVFQGSFMASLDIQDAYYLIPIHPTSRKYLRFMFLGVLYQFTCLVFGLCVGPYICTKIMKPLIQILRFRGSSSVIYLDDIFCIENSFARCQENINETCALLRSVGFIINDKKSNIIPTQTCEFLGFVIDSEELSVKLSNEKRSSLVKAVESFKLKNVTTIREFSQLIGRLIAACPGIDYGWLYTKLMEHEKTKALFQNGMNFEEKMMVPRSIMADLDWWLAKIQTGKCQIRETGFQKIIFTDASNSGWGATDSTDSIHGVWDRGRREIRSYL